MNQMQLYQDEIQMHEKMMQLMMNMEHQIEFDPNNIVHKSQLKFYNHFIFKINIKKEKPHQELIDQIQ
jgi:hypothetical protein